jgi:hypothetical protein
MTSAEKRRALPTAVHLDAGEAGLDRGGYVLCHDLFTLDREVFRRYAGRLSPPRLFSSRMRCAGPSTSNAARESSTAVNRRRVIDQVAPLAR